MESLSSRSGDVVTGRHFPALGFDPAPGDPAVLAAAARAVGVAARTCAVASGGIARLDAVGWSGEAGDGFRSRLAELPPDLDRATRAHQVAGRALGDYGTELRSRQLRAAELEARAAELSRRHAAVAADVDRLGALRTRAGGPRPAALSADHAAAAAHAETLQAELGRVVADARRLHGEHAAAAAATARAIRAASDPPYERPGLLSRARSAVQGWVARHADVLVEISTVLKGVSAVLGVLSLVPGLQFLAPFAMLAGGLALGLDLAAKLAAGRGSWRALALDAALTVVPFGPVARAVKAVPGVTPALRAANRAIPPAVKGGVFRAAGNLPDGISRARVEAAATQIRSRAAHYGDDVIVQGSRAGYSTRPGSDVDIGLRVSPERFREIVQSRFGAPEAGSELDQAMARCLEKGIVHTRRAGLKALHKDLGPILGCKVDLSVVERGGGFDHEPWLPI